MKSFLLTVWMSFVLMHGASSQVVFHKLSCLSSKSVFACFEYDQSMRITLFENSSYSIVNSEMKKFGSGMWRLRNDTLFLGLDSVLTDGYLRKNFDVPDANVKIYPNELQWIYKDDSIILANENSTSAKKIAHELSELKHLSFHNLFAIPCSTDSSNLAVYSISSEPGVSCTIRLKTDGTYESDSFILDNYGYGTWLRTSDTLQLDMNKSVTSEMNWKHRASLSHETHFPWQSTRWLVDDWGLKFISGAHWQESVNELELLLQLVPTASIKRVKGNQWRLTLESSTMTSLIAPDSLYKLEFNDQTDEPEISEKCRSKKGEVTQETSNTFIAKNYLMVLKGITNVNESAIISPGARIGTIASNGKDKTRIEFEAYSFWRK